MNVIPTADDIIIGEWEQMKSRIKQRWGRLTDDQLDHIRGCGDELAGLIRKRYGYTHEKARKTVDEFIQRLASWTSKPQMANALRLQDQGNSFFCIEN